MKRAILGVMLAMGLAGAASAADYVVVASSDPGVKVGLALDAGQRVALRAGQTATLMSASGEVSTLKGGASGATAPRRAAGGDDARVQALAVLVAPPPTVRTFGGRRGGVCPPASDLKTVDQILAAQSGSCDAEARAALQALVARSAK